MKNFAVVNQVIIMFSIILIGVYCRKRKIIDSLSNKAVTALLLNVTLPFNIIASYNFEFSMEMLSNMAVIFIFGMILHPVSYALGRILFNKSDDTEQNILIFAAVFSNCGFMAFPLLESLYGKIGVIYASMFLAPFNIFLWTTGVMLFKKEKSGNNIRSIFNPGLLSVFIGLSMFLLSVKLPFVLQRSFELVGAMTTPLSMIITGVIIAEMDIKRVFSSKSVYYASIVRLIIIPFLSFIILKTIGISGIVLGICVLIAGMPVAAMATVFAERFGGNSLYASQNVFVSTLLSLITIPIFVFLISAI